jgi:DNA polymerase delta subunit 1
MSVMKAFIYNWEVLSADKVIIKAHAIDEHRKYRCSILEDFKPFCFVESTKGKLMRSSLDISEKKPYKMLEFDTYKDMEEFVSEHKGKVFMNDIPVIAAFLGSKNYPLTGWFDIERGSIRPLEGCISATYPKIACFDIECFCSTGQGMPKSYRRKDTITMISVVFHRYLDDEFEKYLLYVGEGIESIEKCTCISFRDEIAMINGFSDLIKSQDPDVVTGYNIFGFDFDYILSRLKLRLKPLPDFSRNGTTSTYKVDWTSNAYGENYYNRIESSGRVFIDMMLYFRRQRLDSYSLDFVSRKYLGKGKMDVLHHGKDDLTTYGTYCVNDSVLTLELFDKFYMWTNVCEMSRVMRCSIEDIYTRGEQMKVVNQAIWSCLERGIILKKREMQEIKEYQGGYVLEPRRGIVNGCSIVDFQSMYPSILIAYNICPSTYTDRKREVHDIPGTTHSFRKSPQGILPNMVENLLSERKLIKKRLSEEHLDSMTHIILDTRQFALKVCANSIYGITGSKNSRYFSSIGCAESVTHMGRRILQKVIEFIEKNYAHQVRVVYGDTDSCMLAYRRSEGKERDIASVKEICTDVTSRLPKPIVLHFEDYYDKILFMSKKRYVIYKRGEGIEYKGVANVRRNYCIFARNLFAEVIERVLDPEKGNAEKHLTYAILKLITSEIPVQQLVMSKAIKSLETYKTFNLPQVIMLRRLLSEGIVLESGSRLEYVFAKNDHKLQGYKMYTPEEVLEKSMQIDYSYYIQKQIVPIMKDIFGEDNYAKKFSKLVF